MCLAVPGKIVGISSADALERQGTIDFGGITKEVSLAFVPEAKLDDYVLVHAGFALNIIDQGEAEKTLALLKEFEPEDQ